MNTDAYMCVEHVFGLLKEKQGKKTNLARLVQPTRKQQTKVFDVTFGFIHQPEIIPFQHVASLIC